jgi:F-type H+-transporting ATPase subunit epsilon
MSGKLNVVVLTPVKEVLRMEADMVVAPSVVGQVGILPEHRPYLADLKPGVVEVRSAHGNEKLAVSVGFIEVGHNNVRILTESAEAPQEIDVAAAEKAVSDAEAKLKKLTPQDEAFAQETLRAEHNRARIQAAAQ